MAQRQPYLVSVPFERRLLHLGLHVGLLVAELVCVLIGCGLLVLTHIMAPPVAAQLGIGFAMWLAVITTAFSFVLSRFPKGPWLILAVHALGVPGSIVLFAVLNLNLLLRLLSGS